MLITLEKDSRTNSNGLHHTAELIIFPKEKKKSSSATPINCSFTFI